MSALTTLTIRQAGVEEFDAVFELLAESIRWLRSKGLDQWSTWENWRDKMRPSLERGDVWLLFDADQLVGTITLEMNGDPDFWTPMELADPSGYVSKLAIRRDHSGRELGHLLLDWAADHSYRLGCNWLRLDAWKTNDDLHDYYRQRGWTYVRRVDNPRRYSGVLFQRVAAPLPRAQRDRLAEVPAIRAIDTLYRVPPESSDPAGNWQPGHFHQVDGILVEQPWLSVRPLTLMPYCRYRIRQGEGGGWVFETGSQGQPWKESGTVISFIEALDPGCQYILSHDDAQPCSIRLMRTSFD